MSSIDYSKLKKIFEKADIIILGHYTMNNKCAMIKCFMMRISEFIMIYIPSKLRFSAPPSRTKNFYELTVLDEDTCIDDYSKISENPDIDTIDEKKSIDIYSELTKKYQKNITSDGYDEPIVRKIRRQISRLRIPFKNLKYDIGTQYDKKICISFGQDNISTFEIRGAHDETERIIFFVVDIKNFIDQIDEIHSRLDNVRAQFYDILKKVSISNFENMSEFSENYGELIHKFITREGEYNRSISEYSDLFRQSLVREDSILKKYKKIVDQRDPDNVKKMSILSDGQKELYEISTIKSEIISKNINLLRKYQLNILCFEEVSFDNMVMLTRARLNTEKLLNMYK